MDPGNSWLLYTGVSERGGGIADGFAVMEGFAYFANKQGDLYKVDVREPRHRWVIDWRSVFPGVDGVFANQIAAVGKDTVYFSVRFTNTGIAGGTGHGKDGALVAVDKGTWTVRWVSAVPGGANTIPLALERRGTVVVGTMDGYILDFDAGMGTADFFTHSVDACKPDVRVRLLRAHERPYKAEQPYQQLNGVGTDPALAWSSEHMYLLSGVNYWVDRNGNNEADPSETGGRLVGYEPGSLYNIQVTDLAISGVTTSADADVYVEKILPDYPGASFNGTRAALEPGREYEVRTTVVAKDLRNAMPVGFLLFYVSDDLSYSRVVDHRLLDFSGGQSTVEVTSRFKLLPSDPKAGFLVALANPESLVRERIVETEFLVEALRPYLPPSIYEGMQPVDYLNISIEKLFAQTRAQEQFLLWLQREGYIASGSFTCNQPVIEAEVREIPVRAAGAPHEFLLFLPRHYDNTLRVLAPAGRRGEDPGVSTTVYRQDRFMITPSRVLATFSTSSVACSSIS